eukprot:GHVP01052880.1.p1 GENE.GHVP01052880.1~~GHVP01052880.1.p1  ORF type:complete len:658 (+),score=132.46 GHVP01052880.1:1400-3373(+)
MSLLTKQTKDLAQNWNIDVGAELETYIGGLETGDIQDLQNLNFAEAAMILQSTTSVYTKKVDHLRTLAYEALSMMNNNRKRPGHTKDSSRNDSNEPYSTYFCVPWTELLESVNKANQHQTDKENLAVPEIIRIQRMPLALLPSKDKSERKLSALHMLDNGALVFREDEALHFMAHNTVNNKVPNSRMNSAHRGSEQLSSQTPLMGNLTATPRDIMGSGLRSARVSSSGALDCDDGPQSLGDLDINLPPSHMPPLPIAKPSKPEIDHWKPLDEHEPQGKDKPLRVKNCIKKPNSKIYEVNLSSITSQHLDLLSLDGVSSFLRMPFGQTENSQKNSGSPFLSSPFGPGYQNSLFKLPVFQDIKLQKLACEKIGLSRDFIGFDDLISEELKNNSLKSRKSKDTRIVGLHSTYEDSDDENDREDDSTLGEDENIISGSPRTAMLRASPYHDDTFLMSSRDTRGAMSSRLDLEPILLSAQGSYAELFSHHVNSMAINSEKGGLGELFEEDRSTFNMHKRVGEWRSHVEKWMQKLNTTGTYNVSSYKEKIISRFCKREGPVKNKNEKIEEDQAIGTEMKFEELVKDMPRHDICRVFLTTLMMTNRRKVGIFPDDKNENSFSVKLLEIDHDKENDDEFDIEAIESADLSTFVTTTKTTNKKKNK